MALANQKKDVNMFRKTIPMSVQHQIQITRDVAMAFDGEVDMPKTEIARALRGHVVQNYMEEDAGADYFYNTNTGMIHIDEEPDWLFSKTPRFDMCKILEVADILDGSDFSTDIVNNQD